MFDRHGRVSCVECAGSMRATAVRRREALFRCDGCGACITIALADYGQGEPNEGGSSVHYRSFTGGKDELIDT
jgi:MinD superfamily P-loop ATPase